MKYDEINKPEGYNYHGNAEAEPITVIASLGLLFPFCVGNAIKYIARYQHKGGKKDLEKALWYLKKAVESEPKKSSLNSALLAGIWDIHPEIASVLSHVMVLELQPAINILTAVLKSEDWKFLKG